MTKTDRMPTLRIEVDNLDAVKIAFGALEENSKEDMVLQSKELLV